jgi:hypothetical protein
MPRWRFTLALIASALLHAGIVAGPGWQVPDDEEVLTRPIEAVLLPPPMLAAAPPAPPAAAPPAAAPAPVAAPRPAAPKKPKPAPAPAAPEVQLPAAEPSPQQSAPPAEPPPPAESPEQAEPAAVSPEQPAASAPQPSPENVFPHHGRVIFVGMRGTDGFPVGTAEAVWLTEGDRYEFRLYMQTAGLVALFKRVSITWKSVGGITGNGFAPASFKVERDGVFKEGAAFYWDRRKVMVASPRGHHEADLMEGSQDILSAIFQIALFPPVERNIDMWVTNGRTYVNALIEVIGHEEVVTKLGPLRALHVRLGREGDDLLDLWYGIDAKYLPVRIRWVQRSGAVNDLQATTIEYQTGEGKVRLEAPAPPPLPSAG